MALHHRQHVDNMRSAYDRSKFSRHSDYSDSDRSYESSSAKSYLTQPTDYSSSPAKKSPHVHYNTYENTTEDASPRFFADKLPQQSPRSSVETYASTVEDDDEAFDEQLPDYDLPEYWVNPHESCVLSATPKDFSELFPSRRRLLVHHDDSTLDGNMNLRVDTEVYSGRRKRDMTLFHLRMHDLKNREFSLRRYCRDSGREVCHSARKLQLQTPSKRPGFQRSLSNALNSIRPKSDSRTPTLDSLKRSDSGYGSMHSADLNDNERPRSAGFGAQLQQETSSDTIKLEFSNYAQVNVKRSGSKGNKRYEFEYWGAAYTWKRVVRKDKGEKFISFHLLKTGSDHVLAYIVPVSLSRTGAQEEQSKGGWVPPCSMWLADDKLINGQKDAVDAIMASGLIALVDDAIRSHFHSKTVKQLLVPMSNMGLEYVGPKRLVNELFRRDTDSTQQSRPSSSWRPDNSGHTSTTSGRITAGASRRSSYE